MNIINVSLGEVIRNGELVDSIGSIELLSESYENLGTISIDKTEAEILNNKDDFLESCKELLSDH
jgi:hypothetical protein